MKQCIVPIISNKSDSSSITVLILGSIPCDRMRTVSSVSMLPINAQQNVLDIQLEAIKTVFPKCEIVMTVGHRKEEIIRKKPSYVRIVENLNYESLAQNEDLRLGVNNITTKNTLIFPGNIIFDSSAIQQFKHNKSMTLFDKNNQFNDNSLSVIDNNGVLENITYGLPKKWTYMTFLVEKELSILRKIVNTKSKEKYCLHESINYVASRGTIYTCPQSNGNMRKITSIKDINRVDICRS